MRVERIKCDNPGCHNVETPEWVSANGKSHRPPYGWLSLKGYFQGTGPSISVEVCSVACLELAVGHAVEQGEAS